MDWIEGRAVVSMITHSQQVEFVATGLRLLACPRELPWGVSRYVLGVHGPVPEGDEQVLRIEVQSGDVIELRAVSIACVCVPVPP